MVADQFLADIESETERLAQLVDELLDLSRISHGKINLRMELVDLGELVRRVAETHRPAAETAGHRLRLEGSTEPSWVMADPVRLEQVFSNIISNAIKYTMPGGRITLGIRREGAHVRVRVADTGIGISPKMLNRVFELFAQGEPSLCRTRDGLGVGLALSKTLVEMHGGKIQARSLGPGFGSEFSLRLPLARPSQAALSADK